MLGQLLPRAVLPYAKAWVALLAPGILIVGQALIEGDPITWALAGKAAGAAIVTACGVYVIPNRDPAGDHQDESVQPPATIIPGTTLDVPASPSIDVPQSSDTKADAVGGSTAYRALKAKQTDDWEG